MSLFSELRSLPKLVWVLFVGTLINRFGSFVFVFLALYLKNKGFSSPQVGFAMGAYGVGAIGASLVGGWLADHFGRRNSIVLSMLLSAVAMLGLSQADGYAFLLVLTALAGFCAELYRPAATALIADITTPAQRVTAFAVYRLSINLGFAIGPAVGGFVAHKSFMYLFIGDAITSLVYAGIAIALIPNRVVAHAADAVRRSAFAAIIRDGAFLCFLAATFVASMVFMQHVSGYPLQMDLYGHSSRVFGLLVSLNGIIICLSEIPLTTFTRRFEPRRVMMIGFLLIGGGFMATGFVSAIPWLVATVVVWTMGEMLFFPFSSAHIAAVSPPDMRGRYQGAWGIAWGLGAVAGPVAGATVLDWNPRALWVGCGIAALAGAFLIMKGAREPDGPAP